MHRTPVRHTSVAALALQKRYVVVDGTKGTLCYFKSQSVFESGKQPLKDRVITLRNYTLEKTVGTPCARVGVTRDSFADCLVLALGCVSVLTSVTVQAIMTFQFELLPVAKACEAAFLRDPKRTCWCATRRVALASCLARVVVVVVVAVVIVIIIIVVVVVVVVVVVAPGDRRDARRCCLPPC
jgi:hypothetical protein